jgi:hypothetical protein
MNNEICFYYKYGLKIFQQEHISTYNIKMNGHKVFIQEHHDTDIRKSVAVILDKVE